MLEEEEELSASLELCEAVANTKVVMIQTKTR